MSLPVGYSGHMHLGEVQKDFESEVYCLSLLFILEQKYPLQHSDGLIIVTKQVGDK